MTFRMYQRRIYRLYYDFMHKTSISIFEKNIKSPFSLFKIWLLLVPNVNLNQI